MKKLLAIALLGLSSLGWGTTTNRLGLTLPAVGSPNWGQSVNTNFQIIDATTNINGFGQFVSTTSIGSGANIFVSSTPTGVLISGTGIPAGSTFYIQNTSTLQSGSTFYVSSGTVANTLYAGNASLGTLSTYGALNLTGYSASLSSYTVLSSSTDPTLYVNRSQGGAIQVQEGAGPIQLFLRSGSGNLDIGNTNNNGYKLDVTGTINTSLGIRTSTETITSLANTILAVDANGVIVSTTVTGGSGSGSGIVSPGTFTWRNNFGVNFSTAEFRGTGTNGGTDVTLDSGAAITFDNLDNTTNAAINNGGSAGSNKLTFFSGTSNSDALNFSGNSTFSGGNVTISTNVLITSTGTTPSFSLVANGTYGTTNGSSGGFFMDCSGGGPKSGYCSQFYTNAGAQLALGGVVNIVTNNPAWNQPGIYIQALNNTSNNNADILVDDGFTPAIAIRETSQSNPSAKKWQYSAHGGVERFENRANDDSGFLPFMQVSSQTFWNDIYVGRTYGNQSNFAQFGVQSDTGNVYGFTLTTSTSNGSPYLMAISTLGVTAMQTATASSGTITGPKGFQVIAFSSPTEVANAIDQPLVHILLESSIGTFAGAQTDGLFVDTLDTGAHTNPLNDMISIHALARQFSNSDSQLIGMWSDAYGQGPGSPNIAAYYAVPAWASDLTHGTTSELIGINITPRVTSLNGLTNKSTGTIRAIKIPDFTNGTGDSGKNWVFWSAAHYPAFFAGNVGIGQSNPAAIFTIGADSTSAYAMIVGTMAFNSYDTQIPPSAYVLTVTTNGVINSHGTHNFVSSFIAQSSAAISGNLDLGVATTTTISSQFVISATPTLTYAMVIGTGPSVVDGSMGTSKYILTLTTSGALNATQGIAANALFATNGSTSSQLSVTGVTNLVGTTTISGLLSPLEFTGGTSAGSGINIQAPIISGAGFQRGFISNNLTFNGGTSLWVAGNNFGTDAASMFFAGGGINFNAFNNLSLPTTLTNTQYTNGTIMFIYPGPAGAGGNGGGVNIGSNANPTTGLSVVSSSGANVSFGLSVGTVTVGSSAIASYVATFSTQAAGAAPYMLDISSTGHMNSQPIVNAATVTVCGANASLSGNDMAGVITTGAASPTACTLTFAKPYGLSPICFCESNGATACDPTSTSSTAITFTLGITETTIRYFCIGRD